jgi:hypothetical protein
MPAINTEIIFNNDLFDFVRVEGIGRNNTPYTDIEVLSKGVAKNYHVSIGFRGCSTPEFIGTPVNYTYTHSYIRYDSFLSGFDAAQTTQFISVLTAALEFKKRIDEYMGFTDTND